MCHRSWAAETPGKYEHDWNYLTHTFAKSKFPVTEKLANGALVTPTPGSLLPLCETLDRKNSTRSKFFNDPYQILHAHIGTETFLDRDGLGSWIPFLWKAKTHLSYRVNSPAHNVSASGRNCVSTGVFIFTHLLHYRWLISPIDAAIWWVSMFYNCFSWETFPRHHSKHVKAKKLKYGR